MKEIAVNEPINVVRTARWFIEFPRSLTDISYMAKGVPQRPHCLAPFVALYLSHAFDGERLLSEIFTFPGKPPKWARQSAQVVTVQRRRVQRGRKGGKYTSTVVDGADIWRRPAPLVTRAKSIHHTLAWFRHLDKQHSSAFCIPSSTNTDLIFVLRLADGTHIWVALQTLVNTAPVDGVSHDKIIEDMLTGLLPQNMLYDIVSQDTMHHPLLMFIEMAHVIIYRLPTLNQLRLGPTSFPKT